MKKVSVLFVSLLFLTAVVYVSSCKKKNEAPVIVFSEPEEGEIYHLSTNDSIHCEFTVTDDNSLHELTVVATNPTGTAIFTQNPMVHDLKTYEFHGHPHPTVTGTHTVKVTVSDHDGLVATAQRTVSIQP
jgi:hypothetical protein